MKKKVILVFLVALFFTGIIATILYFDQSTDKKAEFVEPNSLISSVVLAVVGDCSGYNIVKYQGESLDPLSSVKTLLNQSDIFLFNMEGVLLAPEHLGNSTQYSHQSCFVSPPDFASYMKAGKLTVACLANNHILDGGETGVEETKDAFTKNGIHYLGAGCNTSEACQPLLLTIKDVEIGFLAYNLFEESFFSAGENSPGAASSIVCNVTDSISRLREEVDIVVVILHWGTSWTSEVTMSQITTAEQMSHAGADIVIGHHPHMLQAVKAYGNTLTLFSLGNFIFRPDYNMPSNAHNSMVTFIEITEKKVQQCHLYPIRLDLYGIPRIPTSEEAKAILSNLADLSEAFNTQIEIDKEIGVVHIS